MDITIIHNHSHYCFIIFYLRLNLMRIVSKYCNAFIVSIKSDKAVTTAVPITSTQKSHCVQRGLFPGRGVLDCSLSAQSKPADLPTQQAQLQLMVSQRCMLQQPEKKECWWGGLLQPADAASRGSLAGGGKGCSRLQRGSGREEGREGTFLGRGRAEWGWIRPRRRWDQWSRPPPCPVLPARSGHYTGLLRHAPSK